MPLTALARFGGGVSARIVSAKIISATARRPGEISGPAVQVTTRLANASAKRVSLDNVVANATDATNTPLVSMTSPPASPLTGSLPAGRSATGVYVFELPAGYKNPITVSLYYSATSAVAVFVGTPR